MGKFDFTEMLEDVKKKLGDSQAKVGIATDLGTVSESELDYVVMPEWWRETTGVMGIEFGKIVQIAGDSDSGKTSLALEAIYNAQDQGYGIVYIETEGKTPEDSFINRGIDPKGVLLVQSKILEEAFDAGFAQIDAFFERFPDEKLLFVFDSYGNTITQNDESNTLTKEARVGGSAKKNRQAINILLAKMHKNPIAALIVNYTYDNLGSHGKVNAGGKALNFFCTLIFQSSRTGWIEGTVKGEKVRKGAKVKWRVFKNHYSQAVKDDEGNVIHLPKEVNLSITSEGFKKI